MQAIVEMSRQPLSIFFVGVGTAKFDRLKEMDKERPLRTDFSMQGSRVSHTTFRFLHLRSCKASLEEELAESTLNKRRKDSFATAEEIGEEVRRQQNLSFVSYCFAEPCKLVVLLDHGIA
mmetsp:Transcript_16067/g.66186  ORF Transcript_16067/g.66186 Transcript_16067/m.66186 type:complete len:120 (-) Transcript_16067:2226-2585(-)